MKKLLICAIVIMLLAPFFTVQFKKQFYENRVKNYLIEEVAYQEDAIQSIESTWHFAGLPSYTVNITFSDEPNVIYNYFAHDKNNIHQAEHYTIDGSTLSTDQLKHFKPYE